MGHNIEPENVNWNKLADEVIAKIETSTYRSPVVGLGHSAGAMVMLISATKRPDLFSRLILLEPMLISTVGSIQLSISKASGFRYGYKAPRTALRRRTRWPSKEAALKHFSKLTMFKKFHQQCFEDYIEFGLKNSGDEVTLSFSNRMEAAIFASAPVFQSLTLKEVEVFTVFGERSDILPLIDFQKWKLRINDMVLLAVPGGHLFPFECPLKTVDLINTLLGSGQTNDLIPKLPDHASELQLESEDSGLNISKNEVIVEMAVNEVSEWLAEISNWSLLNPSIAEFSYIDKNPAIQSSTFKQVTYETGTKLPFKGCIVKYQRGNSITVKMEHSAINLLYNYRYIPLGQKTKVEASISFQLKGLFKLMSFLWRPSIRQSFTIQLAGQMKVLKSILKDQKDAS